MTHDAVFAPPSPLSGFESRWPQSLANGPGWFPRNSICASDWQTYTVYVCVCVCVLDEDVGTGAAAGDPRARDLLEAFSKPGGWTMGSLVTGQGKTPPKTRASWPSWLACGKPAPRLRGRKDWRAGAGRIRAVVTRGSGALGCVNLGIPARRVVYFNRLARVGRRGRVPVEDQELRRLFPLGCRIPNLSRCHQPCSRCCQHG